LISTVCNMSFRRYLRKGFFACDRKMLLQKLGLERAITKKNKINGYFYATKNHELWYNKEHQNKYMKQVDFRRQ